MQYDVEENQIPCNIITTKMITVTLIYTFRKNTPIIKKGKKI